MSSNIEKTITTNTTTFITTTIGQGVSLGFTGATSGNGAVKKLLNDGTTMDVTDDAGTALVVDLSADLTVNAWVGFGTDISIVTTSLVGTLVVTANPLKSSH